MYHVLYLPIYFFQKKTIDPSSPKFRSQMNFFSRGNKCQNPIRGKYLIKLNHWNSWNLIVNQTAFLEQKKVKKFKGI
jgi:hypothetical protein